MTSLSYCQHLENQIDENSVKVNGASRSNFVKFSDPNNKLCDTIDIISTSEKVNITFDIIQTIRGGFTIKESVKLIIPCDSDNVIKPGTDFSEPQFLMKIVNNKNGA